MYSRTLCTEIDLQSYLFIGVYPLKQIVTTISMIIKSSYKLDRKQDVIKYTKELLKAYIQRFNNNEIEKVELLGMYSTFIELQIVNKDFSGAKKAIKHLKLFNLNSDDVKDVKISMEKEGYKKSLPLYNFQNDDVNNTEHVHAVWFYKDRNIFFQYRSIWQNLSSNGH